MSYFYTYLGFGSIVRSEECSCVAFLERMRYACLWEHSLPGCCRSLHERQPYRKETIPCHAKMLAAYRGSTKRTHGATSRPCWRLWSRTSSGMSPWHPIIPFEASIEGRRE